MNKELKAEIVRRYGSQFRFAQAIGEHEATVSKVVRERVNLREWEKERWADVLGADKDKIFEPPPNWLIQNGEAKVVGG